MKERQFIEQNFGRWKQFEDELKEKNYEPDRVAEHYIGTIDDLSFARTHYPFRLVRSYLNGVAQLLSLRIHSVQKGTWTGIVRFWTTDLPIALHLSRRDILLSFCTFFAFMLIGMFSAHFDPEFPRAVLGDAYVDMSLDNIAKGDPMAVYKDEEAVLMSLRITQNNIIVSLIAFVLGLSGGIGTFVLLLRNGVMLGAFQQLFIDRGISIEMLLTLWQHGVIEISCIVLAGAAGFALARGLLFPGTFSRMDAFRLSARQGLIMVVALVPLLTLSGFIEGLYTRMTDLHWAIRLATILLSMAFVLTYLWWLPARIARKRTSSSTYRLSLKPIEYSKFQRNRSASMAVLAFETLRHLARHRVVLLLTVVVIFLLRTLLEREDFSSEVWYNDSALFSFLIRPSVLIQDNIWQQGIFFLCANLVLWLLLRAFHHDTPIRFRSEGKPLLTRGLPMALVLSSVYLGLMQLPLEFLTRLVWTPFSALLMHITVMHAGNIGKGLRQAWLYMMAFPLKIGGMYLVMTVSAMLVTLVNASVIQNLVFQNILELFPSGGRASAVWFEIERGWTILVLLFAHLLTLLPISLLVYGMHEYQTSEHHIHELETKLPDVQQEVHRSSLLSRSNIQKTA